MLTGKVRRKLQIFPVLGSFFWLLALRQRWSLSGEDIAGLVGGLITRVQHCGGSLGMQLHN